MTRRAISILASAALLVGAASVVAWLRAGNGTVSPAAVVLGDLVLKPPFVIFRTLAPQDAHGHVAVVSLDPGEAARHVSTLACARVHYAGGAGLCLVIESAPDSSINVAYVFDHTFTRRHRLVLPGVPTRARVSPNGRRASITTYAETEAPEGERLVTDSVIIDVASGSVLANLRSFRIEHEGPPLTGPVDISSVAFEPDGDRFFATLATATTRYLVAGSVDERRLTTLRDGVASEALSPDGRHLVVKRRGAGPAVWRLVVIDLHTWAERALNQGSRSVDDQVEWLDNDHVMFHDVVDDTTAVWMLPIDGITAPRVYLRDAFSAATQR